MPEYSDYFTQIPDPLGSGRNHLWKGCAPLIPRAAPLCLCHEPCAPKTQTKHTQRRDFSKVQNAAFKCKHPGGQIFPGAAKSCGDLPLGLETTQMGMGTTSDPPTPTLHSRPCPQPAQSTPGSPGVTPRSKAAAGRVWGPGRVWGSEGAAAPGLIPGHPW